ncbi:Peroxisome biogenesis 5 -like protein [Gossypium arboreum]|uniref:Peroxisome biogenesis 5-like protein n=1 Tax=Gossypium arboreum TaxID=29729 RepID=A0A0B0PYL7_GOSAR|nr:Peroxisome biogenesis 5 -like protein [Gossypium arboreum]
MFLLYSICYSGWWFFDFLQPDQWAEESATVFCGPDHWANEFGAERLQQESVDDQWVNEFSKLHVDDWAEEFGRQVGEGALGDSLSDNWANSYDKFLSGRTLQGVSLYFLI